MPRRPAEGKHPKGRWLDRDRGVIAPADVDATEEIVSASSTRSAA
jgi:hypothetical protein